MRILTAILIWILGLAILSFAGERSASNQAVLLDDDFSGQTVGMFSAGVIGAHAEYHYHHELAPRGNWQVSCFKSFESQRAWWVVKENGNFIMKQTYQNSKREIHYTHPMIIAGDTLWQNYTLKVEFAPEAGEGQSGVVFRYQNDRCYYFFGVKGNEAILKRVKHAAAYQTPDEKILAVRKFNYNPGSYLTAEITVNGPNITAQFNGGKALEAKDSEFQRGRIGLTSDVPARYRKVMVTTSPADMKKYLTLKQQRENEQKALQNANPKMKLWRKINTAGFGVDRNLRFGDLDGDGTTDVLIGQIMRHGPSGSYNELSCLTAMSFDGRKLWQIGEPDEFERSLTSDVAFQIHDIDRDGQNEVVYCMNSELIVAEGSTGKTKYKAATPASLPPETKFPNILGDCLFFCDVRGQGYPQDLLIKDRKNHFWVMDDKLNVLWKGKSHNKTGHYPFAYDVDKDGKDEIAIGYALYDHDGKMLWTLEKQLNTHADGIAILNFHPEKDAEPQMMYAAGDEGYIRLNLKGEILKHQYVGHVQNPSVANYRPDLPGLETVSVNYHGNQGIVNFYDADGNIYHSFEPAQQGSMMLPVNWTGTGQEYFLLSANYQEGGLFDGWGHKVVAFPPDGHPDLCVAVVDLTGDCRDEIVAWDRHEIWVYTQDDNPKGGKLYKPKRNSLSNYSNYQATVSLPGWSEE